MTARQSDLVIGTLLGDGCLSKVSSTTNSRYESCHGVKQLPYLKHKRGVLSKFEPTRIYEGTATDPNGNDHAKVQFATKTNGLFTSLERAWYERDGEGNYVLKANGHRIKVVPPDLVLNPRIVSYWYCDDGTNTASHRQARLCTNGFTFAECHHLRSELVRLGIVSVSVVDTGREGQFMVHVQAASYIDFLDMVREHVPDCMSYKTSLEGYVAPKVFVDGEWVVLPA